MLRQGSAAVNGKRKQIAIHGQKYAVESTYGRPVGTRLTPREWRSLAARNPVFAARFPGKHTCCGGFDPTWALVRRAIWPPRCGKNQLISPFGEPF